MDTTLTHTHTMAASADEIYRLIADVTIWPVIFEPTVHVQHQYRTEHNERFQMWGLAGNNMRTWVTHRDFSPDVYQVTFRQERTLPPVTAMSGMWSLHPIDSGQTDLTLEHRFSVADNDDMDTVSSLIDRDSIKALAVLARFTQLGHPINELIDTFCDTLVVNCSVDQTYDVICRAEVWPEQLPHVARVELSEPEPGVQQMELDTVTADGESHSARLVRLCSANSTIAEKQLGPGNMTLGHSSLWTFTRLAHGTEVSVTHTVAIDPEAAHRVMGNENTLARARSYVRDTLSSHVRATLTHAGAQNPQSARR